MSLTVNLYYTGKDGDARKFAEEMEKSGIADSIRNEEGNVRYEYFFPMHDPETVLLIDNWQDYVKSMICICMRNGMFLWKNRKVEKSICRSEGMTSDQTIGKPAPVTVPVNS